MFQLFHIGVLAVTVAVIVMGIPGCQILLKLCVFPGSVRMRSQIIPNSKMPFDLCFIAFLEDMDMMGAVIPSFGIEEPAGDAEFAPAVITKGLEFRIMGRYKREVLYHGHNINDRLGGKSFDRSAANVIDSDAVLSKDFPALFLIPF